MALDATRMHALIEAGGKVEITRMGETLSQLLAEYPALQRHAYDTLHAALGHAFPNGQRRRSPSVATRPAPATPVPKTKRRHMSPAFRAKMRASMKARWAAAKKAGLTQLGGKR